MLWQVFFDFLYVDKTCKSTDFIVIKPSFSCKESFRLSILASLSFAAVVMLLQFRCFQGSMSWVISVDKPF